jgi:TPR repeat protein
MQRSCQIFYNTWFQLLVLVAALAGSLTVYNIFNLREPRPGAGGAPMSSPADTTISGSVQEESRATAARTEPDSTTTSKPSEPKGAFESHLKDAKDGNAEAEYQIGKCYQTGDGVKQDSIQAAKWFRFAAGQGLNEAQFSLGQCYFDGNGEERDVGKAVELWRQAADQGLAEAQFSLGQCYFQGRGVEKDTSKAAELWRKAADQGVSAAQFCLGQCYFDGTGVDKDVSRAAELWQQAAKQGDAYAQNNLGNSYLGGLGIPRDPIKAVEWFQKAADKGLPNAQYDLAMCYSNGTGIEKDVNKAIELYQAAAIQGYALAQYNIGISYMTGQGMDRDPQKAVGWFQKAANQGNAASQYALGLCYWDGAGVAKDLFKASEWFQKAADQGDPDATEKLKQYRSASPQENALQPSQTESNPVDSTPKITLDNSVALVSSQNRFKSALPKEIHPSAPAPASNIPESSVQVREDKESPISSNNEITPKQVEDFINENLRLSNHRDIDGLVETRADQVDYFDNGIVDRDFIRSDISKYFQRWPYGEEALISPIRIKAATASDSAVVSFKTHFQVQNQKGEFIEGDNDSTLTVRNESGALKIVSEKSNVTRRHKGQGVAPSVGPVPTGVSLP